ncbi:MAG: LysR family transcriptional regulator [Gammaproteobacteria bacterium]|uniref:LysR substrate-binding domain-containing protein n=1 Tax=Pseudomaricurvus alcaniphilus TaxID=1166482 RepID=UPI00140CEFF8|nr:LysR family transcriptional regulator [Gammaproteobacteria bacterium]NHN37168.1 LysR family transcriptional regulator [Pseudomaricurvus alcaniphilus]
MDSLSDIVVFAKVVESGSFTAAAEHLSLSKSVVSKYVTRLEERLGARLLNRTTRRISLTEIGATFYRQSQQGLQVLEDAAAEVSRLQGEPRGTLRINAPMSFGVLHLAPAIPDFLSRYPELAVDVQFDDRKVDVIEGAFDVSIRIADIADSSLVARRIAPCRHVLVAAPDYLQRRGIPATPLDLQEHSIVSYQYQESARQWEFVDPRGKSIMVPVQATVQMNNSLGMREAVLNGAGIMRTPTFVVGSDIRQGRLQPLLTSYKTLQRSIYIVFPQRRHLSPKIRAFIDFMAERITATPYWDE